MRILCFSQYSHSYEKIADTTIPTFVKYCIKNGYEFELIKITNWKFHYRKNQYLQEKMKSDIDFFFYLDCDAKITNLSTPITQFIDEEHDLFITKDINGINGGSLIIKNTEGGRWLNYFILSKRNEFNNEQEVIEYYMKDPEFSKHVKVLSHPSINSYPYEYYSEFKDVTPQEGQWIEGESFVLHTPALPLEKRAEILQNAKITE